MVGYAVVFRGAKVGCACSVTPVKPPPDTRFAPAQSAEELQRELLEDQRVIEARMRAMNGDAAFSPSPTSTAPVDVPGQTPEAASRHSPASDASSPPPSTPLSALPMLSPGSERLSSPTAHAHDDEDARLAAFMQASPSQPLDVPQQQQQQQQQRVARTASGRRLVINARMRDHYPPELLASIMREGGGTVSVSALDDALLMQAIWASLQDAPPGAGDEPSAHSPGGASGSSTSEVGSEGDSGDDDMGDDTSGAGGSTDTEAEEVGGSSRSLPHELHPSVSYDNLTRRSSMGAQSWEVGAMAASGGGVERRVLPRVNSTVFEEREPMHAPSQPDDDVATPPAGHAPPAPWAVQNNAAFEAGPPAGGDHGEANHAVDLAPHATEAAPAGAGGGEEPDNSA
jgi:hypothetical protein